MSMMNMEWLVVGTGFILQYIDIERKWTMGDRGASTLAVRSEVGDGWDGDTTT